MHARDPCGSVHVGCRRLVVLRHTLTRCRLERRDRAKPRRSVPQAGCSPSHQDTVLVMVVVGSGDVLPVRPVNAGRWERVRQNWSLRAPGRGVDRR